MTYYIGLVLLHHLDPLRHHGEAADVVLHGALDPLRHHGGAAFVVSHYLLLRKRESTSMFLTFDDKILYNSL
jgi:hypothetical protein